MRFSLLSCISRRLVLGVALGLVAPVTVGSMVACGSDEPAVGADDSDLVGGALAKVGQFPSTMLVRRNCTVSRVGARQILTAAHCVVDKQTTKLRAEFTAGATIEVTSKVDVDRLQPSAEDFRSLRLVATHVIPAYAEERDGIGAINEESLPDVAIMEIDAASEQKLADVPIASVDLRPVAPGDPVVIMGYGCEKGLDVTDDRTRQRLRFERTAALASDKLLHPGSWVFSLDTPFARNVVEQYVITPGNNLSEEEASLCPGDSGGPVYRDAERPDVVVGVNAYYSFKPKTDDPNRVSITNWHTRLDGQSRFDVGAWLSERGVRLTGGEPSKAHESCTSARDLAMPTMCGAFANYARAHKREIGNVVSAARFVTRDGGRTWSQRFAKASLRLENGVVTSTPLGACAGRFDGAYCTDSKTVVRCEGGEPADTITCDTECMEEIPGEEGDASCSPPDVGGGGNGDAGAGGGGTDAGTRPPPRDFCNNPGFSDGRYCGPVLGDAEAAKLYQCIGKATFGTMTCPRGCEVVRGGPDRCK